MSQPDTINDSDTTAESDAANESEKAPDARVVRTQNNVLEATMKVLVEEGWDAVTHPHVARTAGYSKATVYAHWPDRLDLLRSALKRITSTSHHEPIGDLQADILAELRACRAAILEHRLDRVMVTLADKAMTNPDVVELRDTFVSEGEQVVRSILEQHLDGPELEATLSLLVGAVFRRVFFIGKVPADHELEAFTRITLRGAGLID